MEKEILFARTLEQVKRQARNQGGMIEEDDVKAAFSGLELSGEQLDMIYDYLGKHGIGIGGPAAGEEYLTEEDRNYLALYLEEIRVLEDVTEGERRALTLSAMAGERNARNRLIEIYLPYVVDVARLYAGQGILLEDLVGEGNVALAAGVEMLGCLERPEEAQGMLGRMMMDAMEDYIAGNTTLEKAGNRAAEQVNHVADKARELSGELMRKVTVEELSAETDLAPEEIRVALRLSGGIEEIEDTEYGAGRE